MFKEIYEEFWPLIDPAIYALYASLTFYMWVAIF